MDRIRKDLQALADPKRANVLRGFFKTGQGQYGEGDVFLGISMPKLRHIAKIHGQVDKAAIKELLHSDIHEERLAALLIMVRKYPQDPEGITRMYLDNLTYVNNWDLVDLTAPKILWPFLENSDRSILYRLAKSKVLWERRVAIIATFHFIRKGDFSDALKISEILLCDEHELIHKAVGWMLREIGKRSVEAEVEFLQKNYKKMPRTMLRYAIERFPEKKRQAYLKGKA